MLFFALLVLLAPLALALELRCPASVPSHLNRHRVEDSLNKWLPNEADGVYTILNWNMLNKGNTADACENVQKLDPKYHENHPNEVKPVFPDVLRTLLQKLHPSFVVLTEAPAFNADGEITSNQKVESSKDGFSKRFLDFINDGPHHYDLYATKIARHKNVKSCYDSFWILVKKELKLNVHCVDYAEDSLRSVSGGLIYPPLRCLIGGLFDISAIHLSPSEMVKETCVHFKAYIEKTDKASFPSSVPAPAFEKIMRNFRFFVGDFNSGILDGFPAAKCNDKKSLWNGRTDPKPMLKEGRTSVGHDVKFPHDNVFQYSEAHSGIGVVPVLELAENGLELATSDLLDQQQLFRDLYGRINNCEVGFSDGNVGTWKKQVSDHFPVVMKFKVDPDLKAHLEHAKSADPSSASASDGNSTRPKKKLKTSHE